MEMVKTDVTEKIIGIMSEITDIPVEDIEIGCSLMDDLELSSLEVMATIAELEREYEMQIPEKALRSFITIEDIVEYIFFRRG